MNVSPTINSVHGRLRSITGTDPAANTEISEIVPARRRWKIITIAVTLVTDDNPANRQVEFIFDDGTFNLFKYNVQALHTASLTWLYSLSSAFSAEVAADTLVAVPIPDLILGPGYRFRTSITNRQIGDNYSAPQLLVEEWIDS